MLFCFAFWIFVFIVFAFLRRLRRDGDTFERVLVFLPEAMDGSDVKVVAERANFSFFPEHLEVVFQGARVVKDAEESWSESLILRPRFDSLFNAGERPRHRAKHWPTSELRAHLAAGTPTERVEAYEYEIHRRHAVSWTYVLFLLVGMPIGVRLRRGSQLAAFAVATAIALFYYALSMRLGKELAYQGSVPAWLGAWAVNLIGGVIGAWMSWTELRR